MNIPKITVEDDYYVYHQDGNIFSKHKNDFLKFDTNTPYCKFYNRNNKKNKEYVHRTIFEKFNGKIPDGKVVDHIDNNPSNNHIDNLQLLSHQQNTQKSNISKNNKSGYIGVSWSNDRRKWVSHIMHNRKCIHLGRYDNIDDAIIAYNDYATYLNETENCHYTLN